MAEQSAMTPYGEKNAQASTELGLFSFMVGKWRGNAKVRLPQGGFVDVPLTWIGRYVLDGTAIADEFHSTAPDGSPFLGISLRQYDAAKSGWIIDYVNVSNSILRRQVNARSGAVRRDRDAIVVISEDGPTRIREFYRPIDARHFTYSTDLSRDEGRTWEPSAMEISMQREE